MEELTHNCHFCNKGFNGTDNDELILFQVYMDLAICPVCAPRVKEFMKKYFLLI